LYKLSRFFQYLSHAADLSYIKKKKLWQDNTKSYTGHEDYTYGSVQQDVENNIDAYLNNRVRIAGNVREAARDRRWPAASPFLEKEGGVFAEDTIDALKDIFEVLEKVFGSITPGDPGRPAFPDNLDPSVGLARELDDLSVGPTEEPADSANLTDKSILYDKWKQASAVLYTAVLNNPYVAIFKPLCERVMTPDMLSTAFCCTRLKLRNWCAASKKGINYSGIYTESPLSSTRKEMVSGLKDYLSCGFELNKDLYIKTAKDHHEVNTYHFHLKSLESGNVWVKPEMFSLLAARECAQMIDACRADIDNLNLDDIVFLFDYNNPWGRCVLNSKFNNLFCWDQSQPDEKRPYVGNRFEHRLSCMLGLDVSSLDLTNCSISGSVIGFCMSDSEQYAKNENYSHLVARPTKASVVRLRVADDNQGKEEQFVLEPTGGVTAEGTRPGILHSIYNNHECVDYRSCIPYCQNDEENYDDDDEYTPPPPYEVDIVPSYDVDIAVHSKQVNGVDPLLDEVARKHFTVIKKVYPNAILTKVKKLYSYTWKIHTMDSDEFSNFPPFEYYSSPLLGFCSHHVAPVRACYTAAKQSSDLPPRLLATASAIHALQTREIEEFYYFMGKKAPQDVLYKYLGRSYVMGSGMPTQIKNSIIGSIHSNPDFRSLTGSSFGNNNKSRISARLRGNLERIPLTGRNTSKSYQPHRKTYCLPELQKKTPPCLLAANFVSPVIPE
jgi:hypothetical protein